MVDLGGTTTEKVNIPMFDDHSRHETMFLFLKRFNIMVMTEICLEKNREIPQIQKLDK